MYENSYPVWNPELQILFFQTRRSKYHWDYCLTMYQHFTEQDPRFIHKFTSSFHFRSWRRKDDYTMTSTWSTTCLPTCSVQMLALLLVNDWLDRSLSLVSSKKYSLSRRSISVVNLSKHSFSFPNSSRPVEDPGDSSSQECVRWKMQILFFLG